MVIDQSDDDEKAVLDKVKRLGYRVSKPGPYIRNTFNVQADTLKRFREAAASLHFHIQDAVTEALDMWLDSKRTELKASQKIKKPPKSK